MPSRLRTFFMLLSTKVLNQWIVSLQTYPLTHLIVLIMTVTWMIIIEQDYNSIIMDTLLKIMATGALSLPLTLAKPGCKYASLGIIVMGLGYGLLLPQYIQNIHYSQQLWIIGSIVIAWIMPSVVLAWDYKDSQDLTWSQFGHRWMSLAQGVIGGLILWGGVAASLASIEFLFDVTIHSTIYQYIGVISVLCIGTWIWLINLQQSSSPLETKGNPRKGKEALGEVSYPRRMRIFGQYIFLPLCVIYGLILIAYGIKIITTGTWPQGQLVYMVAGYVGFGLLTWFFLLPLEKNNSWLSKSYHALFISFVVTSGLIIGALIMRVQQYGWTIDRGIVVALIAWIIIMGVGSLIWTSKKWIIGLGSLIVVGALAIYSLPSMIFSHQLNKVQSLLTTATSNTGDATALYGSLDYLAQNYGTGRLGDVLSSGQIKSLVGIDRRSLASNIMNNLGISFYNNDLGHNPSRYFSFYSTQQGIIDIIGYSKLVHIDSYSLIDKPTNGISIDKQILSINTGGIIANINLEPHASKLADNKQTPDTPYIITGDNYKLILTNANGQQNFSDEQYNIEGFGGYLLLK